MLVAVSLAAPNPAVNRIDAPPQRLHSTTIIGSKTTLSSSTAPHITLKPRNPAVNRIDAVGVNVHGKPTSSSAHSSSFRTLVSTTVGPHIALNPRDPAVNRIDAPGHKPHSSTRTSSATAASSSNRPHAPIEERAPAVNRIDAVGNGVVDQALVSVVGGTPVTLAITDVQQLEVAATEIISAAAAPMPVISVNPLPDNTAVPASFFAGPTPSSSAIPFEVPDTETVIYITVDPDRPIAKLDMGQVLLHALSELRETINENGEDGWLPEDDWSWFAETWNCLLTAERNLIPGPGGRAQHLTYGVLHNALVGLWGAMYSHGRYFACDFEIEDAQWGIVGSGSMNSWNKSEGNLTTS